MLLTSSQVHSQEKKEPRGKAIVEIYTNFHSGFGAARNDRGFELERSYIGYQYHWGHSITVKGVIDVGVSDVVDGYQNIAYIKNALISWNAGAFTLAEHLPGGHAEQLRGLLACQASFKRVRCK